MHTTNFIKSDKLQRADYNKTLFLQNFCKNEHCVKVNTHVHYYEIKVIYQREIAKTRDVLFSNPGYRQYVYVLVEENDPLFVPHFSDIYYPRCT